MPYSTVSFRITLMTLSDLAKYSMTQSVVRSLCDSWASCLWHRQSVYDFLLVWSVTPQSSNRVSTSLGNSGLCWTVFTWNRDTAVPAEGNCDLQTLICVLVARPRRCLTLSNSLTKLNGGLSRLHSADEDTVSWLTSYGSWHAYEKKKKYGL